MKNLTDFRKTLEAGVDPRLARHYLYSCKLRNTFPMLQMYTQ